MYGKVLESIILLIFGFLHFVSYMETCTIRNGNCGHSTGINVQSTKNVLERLEKKIGKLCPIPQYKNVFRGMEIFQKYSGNSLEINVHTVEEVQFFLVTVLSTIPQTSKSVTSPGFYNLHGPCTTGTGGANKQGVGVGVGEVRWGEGLSREWKQRRRLFQLVSYWSGSRLLRCHIWRVSCASQNKAPQYPTKKRFVICLRIEQSRKGSLSEHSSQRNSERFLYSSRRTSVHLTDTERVSKV